MLSDQLASRMLRVRHSATAEISAKVRALAAAGKNVINLGEGELDFDTPSHIKEAGIAAIRSGATKYTAVAGTADLKQAIVEKFRRENSLTYAPSQVIAGAGAKQLIFNGLLATVSSGDEVIIPAPYWVSYPDMVAIAEGEARIVPCREVDGWKLSGKALAAALTPRTRWVMLNSPNNPTGAVYAESEMRALTDVLVDHPRILVMADDIYEHMRYGADFCTPASVEPRLFDRTLTVNGVSKVYSMTGWRIGYAGGPAWLIAAMEVLQSQSTSNASSVSQAAAAAALSGGTDFLADWLEELALRRALSLRAIEEIDGLSCTAPEGAFYAYVNCAALIGRFLPNGDQIQNDLDFARYLLEAAHVGVVHGAAFGVSPYVRIAYAVDRETLADAFGRIGEACERLKSAEAA